VDSSNDAVHNVFHVEYSSGDTVELLEHDEDAQPFAVTYDPTTMFVYWSDIHYSSINRYSLRSRNRTTIYKDGAG